MDFSCFHPQVGLRQAPRKAICRAPHAIQPLFRQALPRYIERMIHEASLTPKKLAIVALAGVSLAAIAGVAFAGWLNHGADIFLAMAETGLSWCF